MEDNIFKIHRYEISGSSPSSINMPLPTDEDEIAYKLNIVARRSTDGDCLKVYELFILKSALNTPQNLATILANIQQKTSGSDITLSFTGTTVNGYPNLNIAQTGITNGYIKVIIQRVANLI